MCLLALHLMHEPPLLRLTEGVYRRGQYNVFDDILQLVSACYVSPLPNSISKSPKTKLNESTSANFSLPKKGFAIDMRP